MASTPKPRRLRGAWAAVAAACLLLYGLASALEAAERPADFGYNEPLTWSRMFAALRLLSWSDLASREVPPFCAVAVLGMIGALLWNLWPRRPRAELKRAAVWGYTLLLVVSGGWMCLAALPFELFEQHDGECLQDAGLRMMVVGAWTIVCLIASWGLRFKVLA